MRITDRRILLLAAAGVLGGLAAVADAQPQTPRLINITGATLLENMFSSAAQGNDYIDANNDGYSRFLNPAPQPVQRLNLSNNLCFVNPYPPLPGTISAPRLHWIIQYRAVGSVNGFVELRDFGRRDLSGTLPSSWTTTDCLGPILSRSCARAYANADGNSTGERYINAGSGFGRANFNPGNPGGAPVRSLMDGSYLATAYTGDYVSCGDTVPADDATGPQEPVPPFHCPGVGGIQMDIAPVDVPSRWVVRQSGTANPTAKPIAGTGYGDNTRRPTNKAGVPAATNPVFFNQLPDLGGRNLYIPPINPNDPPNFADVNTIFDTRFAFAPVAPVTNYGTGRTQVTMAELRHHFATGRMPSGENYMAICRDVGSGTHNAFMNSIGLDPSWGVGENIAGLSNGLSSSTSEDNLGAAFVPSNKSGNPGVENATFNHRLGIGYVGAERGINNGWLPNRGEILAVQKDGLRADGQPGDFVRPTIDRVLNNGLRGQTDPSDGSTYTVDGWQIGGPAVLATLGFPRNAPANKGGWGWLATETGPNPNASLPAMSNVEAAAYVNNVSRSIEAINANPGAASNDSTPGEFIASVFILNTATDYAQVVTDPFDFQPNPDRRQVVQDFTDDPGFNALSNPAYLAFNTTQAGLAPTRNSGVGVDYGDGVPNGANYIDQSGAAVAYASDLDANPALLTNRIAGDFNGDGVRNTSDVNDMLLAYKSRNVGPNTWRSGQRVVIEIIGDFTGDGRFNKDDVRYWADGLHMVGGALNRKAGFVAVDNASSAAGLGLNFFGTALATGKPYAAGDSRGDVCGPSQLTTRGFVPLADGAVNANDIDFVYRQFKRVRNPAISPDDVANWADLNEAANFDLSADMTGDLVVDQCDVDELVVNILGTAYGDVNLDGRVQLCDVQTIEANLGQNGGWAQGDMNGDGVINAADRSIARCHAVSPGSIAPACPPGAINPPAPTPAGVAAFVSIWFASVSAGSLAGDFDCNGSVNPADVAAFVSLWFDVVQNGC
jgi:hypothetical protein